MGIASLRDATSNEKAAFGCNVIATALVSDGPLARAGAFAPCGIISLDCADMRKLTRAEVTAAARALTARGAAYSVTLSFNPDWDEEEEEEEEGDSD